MRRAWVAGAITISLLAGCTSGSSDTTRAHEVRSIRHPELEAFMRVEATPAQTGAVLAVIRTSRLVRAFEFVSQQDAFREFGRLFADEPALVAATAPNAVPASFRLKLVDGGERGQVERVLKRLAGVDVLVTRAECIKFRKRLPEPRRTAARSC